MLIHPLMFHQALHVNCLNYHRFPAFQLASLMACFFFYDTDDDGDDGDDDDDDVISGSSPDWRKYF